MNGQTKETNSIPIEETPTRAYIGLFAVVAAVVFASLWWSPDIARIFLDHARHEQPASQEPSPAETGLALLGAAFSGIAMAGVIVTLWMQREELRQQREQLRQQTKELESTTTALENTQLQAQRQADSLARQVFESGFFHLLGNIAEQRRGLFVASTAGNRTATAGMEHLAEQLVNRMGPVPHDALYGGAIPLTFVGGDISRELWPNPARLPASLSEVRDRIDVMESRVLYVILGSFFECVATAIRYVNSSPSLSESDKVWFAEVLRSQLSMSERRLLAYHCLGSKGSELKTLLHRYDMFRGLVVADFADEQQWKWATQVSVNEPVPE